MTTEGRLLRQVALDNGLTVYFHDRSKPIAGDRCQVRLHITIPITVKVESFDECSNPRQAFEDLTSALGNTLQFTLEKVRNFVDEDEADTLLDQMTQEFLHSNQAYLSSDKFPKKFTVKTYEEWKEQESWRKNQREAMRNPAEEG